MRMFEFSQISVLDWLLIALVGVFGLTCVWLAAWQTVRSSSSPMLFGRSVPTWLLISSSLLSVSVIVGILARNSQLLNKLEAETSALQLGQISLLDWFFITAVAFFALVCLLIGGRQFQSSNFP